MTRGAVTSWEFIWNPGILSESLVFGGKLTRRRLSEGDLALADSNKNVLLIFCDELRADALGCFDNDIVRTPNIDCLAQEGTVFEQCMVTQPTCTPCRASVLTGLYPSALRSRMVGCRTPDDPRFLPRIFSSRGYRSASIGKIHLVPQGWEPDAIEESRTNDGDYDYYGFRKIDLVNGHGDNCFGPKYTKWLLDRVPDAKGLKKRRRSYPHGVRNTYTWELPPEVHSSNYIGEQTVRFLKSACDQSFFLHVSFPDPHHPFTAPVPYACMYEPEDMPPPIPPVTESSGALPLQRETYFGGTAPWSEREAGSDRVIGTPPANYSQYTTEDWQQVKAIYYGMISLVDENVGRILAALKETGLDENTVVVFVSDHGDYLGDHGFYGKGFHYDSVIRAPLIFRGPGIQRGQGIGAISSVLDIAPSLLDIAGIEEPEGVQGCSMKQALAGQQPLARQAALTENDDDFVPMKVRTLTTRDWKLTYYCGQELGELYDRKNDPEEMTNRWNDPALDAVRAELTGMLMEEIMCSFDVSNGRGQNPRPPLAKWVPRHNRSIDKYLDGSGE